MDDYVPLFKPVNVNTGMKAKHPDADGSLNWQATVFCFHCGDLMIADEEYGWDCLTCGGTLCFEDDDHWHFRHEGFYDGQAKEEVDEWKGEA